MHATSRRHDCSPGATRERGLPPAAVARRRQRSSSVGQRERTNIGAGPPKGRRVSPKSTPKGSPIATPSQTPRKACASTNSRRAAPSSNDKDADHLKNELERRVKEIEQRQNDFKRLESDRVRLQQEMNCIERESHNSIMEVQKLWAQLYGHGHEEPETPQLPGEPDETYELEALKQENDALRKYLTDLNRKLGQSTKMVEHLADRAAAMDKENRAQPENFSFFNDGPQIDKVPLDVTPRWLPEAACAESLSDRVRSVSTEASIDLSPTPSFSQPGDVAASLEQREAELHRRESELRRREAELRGAGGSNEDRGCYEVGQRQSAASTPKVIPASAASDSPSMAPRSAAPGKAAPPSQGATSSSPADPSTPQKQRTGPSVRPPVPSQMPGVAHLISVPREGASPQMQRRSIARLVSASRDSTSPAPQHATVARLISAPRDMASPQQHRGGASPTRPKVVAARVTSARRDGGSPQPQRMLSMGPGCASHTPSGSYAPPSGNSMPMPAEVYIGLHRSASYAPPSVASSLQRSASQKAMKGSCLIAQPIRK